MAIPPKEQMTGSNTTEAQFKSGMNGIVDYLDEVDKQSLTFGTTEELKLAKAKVGQKAKTLDTGKVWEWDGSEWGDTGEGELDQAKNYFDEFIQPSAINYDFCSQDGFKQAEIGHNFLSLLTVNMKINIIDRYIQYLSKDGFDLNNSQNAFDAIRTINNMVQFVSKDGFELQLQGTASPSSEINKIKKYIDQRISELKPTVIDTSKPLFTDLIIGFDDTDIEINVECLIAQRDLQRKQRTVVASISADDVAYFKQSAEFLTIQANQFNEKAKLYLRDINSYNYTSLDLTVKSVPKTGLTGSPKILMIGDSITNRGGAAIVSNVLESTGLTPEFIGTITGAGIDQSALGTQGQLNEGREGWRIDQFTNVNIAKTPVPVGGESAYTALVKNDKIKWNPFIREATSSDSSDIIKNEYVLDFSFYQSRFSLEKPDIVFIQLGTNDIIYNPVNAEESVYENLIFMVQRIKAAWPQSKIIISSVGRGISNSSGDDIYNTIYTKVFRSTQKAVNDSGSGDIYFCPSFAIADTLSGFPITPTDEDPVSGAMTGNYSDSLHPILSGRQTLYTNIAAYIAAAAINLI